ncbi:type III-B CRISPR module-associated protein Cmr3 [Peptococcaceae bacterium]|nr:type III-B CRISPR module-associated protein Cmr3 [Peptococcaceae bacterium]
MIVEIKPLGTLFFRDSKPFSMGEETWADAVFPLHPSVIYGALRSCYFANNSNNFKKANSKDDPTLSLRIKFIGYKYKGMRIYCPLPLDCVVEKGEDEERTAKVLRLKKILSEFFSNSPTSYLLTYDKDEAVETIYDGLICKRVFERYLNLEQNELLFYQFSEVLQSEPKIGITRDRQTLSSEEGKLYRVDMKRLKDLSIVVEFEGVELPNDGLLKLGGEGKAVYYEKTDEDLNISFPDFSDGEKYFKLVLITPAIFTKGWLPSWIHKDSLEGEHNGIKLKLLTAAIGKPVYVGGFDIKEKKAKANV